MCDLEKFKPMPRLKTTASHSFKYQLNEELSILYRWDGSRGAEAAEGIRRRLIPVLSVARPPLAMFAASFEMLAQLYERTVQAGWGGWWNYPQSGGVVLRFWLQRLVVFPEYSELHDHIQGISLHETQKLMETLTGFDHVKVLCHSYANAIGHILLRHHGSVRMDLLAAYIRSAVGDGFSLREYGFGKPDARKHRNVLHDFIEKHCAGFAEVRTTFSGLRYVVCTALFPISVEPALTATAPQGTECQPCRPDPLEIAVGSVRKGDLETALGLLHTEKITAAVELNQARLMAALDGIERLTAGQVGSSGPSAVRAAA